LCRRATAEKKDGFLQQEVSTVINIETFYSALYYYDKGYRQHSCFR